jgi:hypothetical protein
VFPGCMGLYHSLHGSVFRLRPGRISNLSAASVEMHGNAACRLLPEDGTIPSSNGFASPILS